jgi:prophage regulatory protein
MRIIREANCRAITGLSRSTRYRLEKLGQFPRRRQLSPNTIGWVLAEIEEWAGSRRSTASQPLVLDEKKLRARTQPEPWGPAHTR